MIRSGSNLLFTWIHYISRRCFLFVLRYQQVVRLSYIVRHERSFFVFNSRKAPKTYQTANLVAFSYGNHVNHQAPLRFHQKPTAIKSCKMCLLNSMKIPKL